MSIFDDLFNDDDTPEFYDNNEEVMNTALFTPSNIGEQYFSNIFGNTNLKSGIIIKVYEIDDDQNQNKKFPEYDVLIVEQKQNSTVEPVIYKKCIAIDSFGGIADFLEFKLRPVEEKKETDTPLNTNFKDQFGNMVLLLCLDGVTDKGIILNSVPHPGRKSNLTKEKGVHLEGEYNGLNWQINKEGELTITFKSKTNIKGEPQDETAGGTTVKMDKKGSVDVNTNLEGNEETYIRMDKENKDIGLKAGSNVGFTAKKDIASIADGSITGKAKGSIEFDAEGSAKVRSKNVVNIEGKSLIGLKTDTVKLEASNLFNVKSNKMIVNASKIVLGNGGEPAIVRATKFVGTGAHGKTVKSEAIGPFSKTVFIAP